MSIKDYIYLDETLLNSSLAQYDKGLVQEISQELETQKAASEGKSKESTNGLEGLFSVGITGTRTSGEFSEKLATESQKDILNSVVHDHAVDLLIEKREQNHDLKKILSKAKEGDFVLVKDSFYIYDFRYIMNSTSIESLSFMYNNPEEDDHLILLKDQIGTLRTQFKVSPPKQKDKSKLAKLEVELEDHVKNQYAIFTKIYELSVLGNNLFENSKVISFEGGICICDNNFFRMNSAQLATLNDSKREISFFGVVTSSKEKTHEDGEFGEVQASELGKIPYMLSDIILSSFDILKENDKYIKPIAIYFE